jgi:plastocyanin
MRRVLLAIGVIVVLVIVGLVLAGNRDNSSPSPSVQPTASTQAQASESPSQSAATITYDSSGFHPDSTTVKSGDSVTFVNKSSAEIQVDSNPHPVHTDDTDLNVGSIAPGQSVTVTLTKKGTFGLHNHLSPGNTTKITIQ